MSIGQAFLNLLGNDDPRKALLQALAGGGDQAAQQGAAPAAGAPYASSAAAGGATAAPAAGGGAGAQPQQEGPQAYKPTPELESMYGDLLRYRTRETNINRGVGLIGAGLAQPENREAVLNSFMGSDTGIGDEFTGLLGAADNIRKRNLALENRKAQLAALPAIAKKYGLDLDTAKYLFETGKLDGVIADEEKPNNELATDPVTGQTMLIDKTGNQQLGTFGTAKPKALKEATDAVTGETILYDEAGNEIRRLGSKKPEELKEATDANGQTILYDAAGNEKKRLGSTRRDLELVDTPRGKVLVDKSAVSPGDVVAPRMPDMKTVEDPNRGTLAIDLNNPNDKGRVIAAPDNRTVDTKNYDQYVSDEIRRGNMRPLSFNDWDHQNRKASATSVTVNSNAELVNKEQESAAKEIGTYQGRRYVAVMEQGDNARQMLDQYDAVEAALKSGVRTGSLGEAELAVRKVGQYIGLNDANDPKVTGGELVQKVQNRMALLMRNPESGMGMPGSVSDRDIKFLTDSQVGLSTSEQGNNIALEVFRRLEERKIALAQVAEDYYKENGTMQGFNRAATEYNKANPLFDDLAEKIKPVDPAEKRRRALQKYNVPE